MNKGQTTACSGKIALLAVSVPALFILLTAGACVVAALNLPSFFDMVKWFFVGGEEVSPEKVVETLLESPRLVLFFFIAAVAALFAVVAAFRILLPRGREANEAGWNAALGLFGTAALFFIFQIIGTLIAALPGKYIPTSGDGAVDSGIGRVGAVAMAISAPVAFVLLLFLVKMAMNRNLSEMGFRRKAATRKFFFGVLLMVLIFPAIRLTGHINAFFLNGIRLETEAQDVIRWFFSEQNPWFLALGVFSAVVIAPVWEEALFRGFLQQGLKRTFGGDVAIVLSATLFALVHCSISAFVPIFILGLIIGYVFDRTGSLWVPIGFHAAFNAVEMTLLLLIKHRVI